MRVPLFIIVSLYLGGFSLVVGSSPIKGTDFTSEDYRFSSSRRRHRRRLEKKEMKMGMGIFDKVATAEPSELSNDGLATTTMQPTTTHTKTLPPKSFAPTASRPGSIKTSKDSDGGPMGPKGGPDNIEKLKKKTISAKQNDKMDKLEDPGIGFGMMGGMGGKGKGGDSGGGGMMGGMSKNGKGMGKGKGKGGPGPCVSPLASVIQASVPEVTTQNPTDCCTNRGPSAVFVTHAMPDSTTDTGFESFWDTMYNTIDKTSGMAGVCFVMTGYDGSTARNLSNILTDVVNVASRQESVSAMMTTDPTSTQDLLNTVRNISNSVGTPSIGVFNTGYPNIVIEALVSGQDRLPFVGYQDDTKFGSQAATITLTLLKGVPAVPLCFNGRPDLAFIGQRCAVYYNALTSQPIQPTTGLTCNASTPIQDIYFEIRDKKVNAVWAHLDCCNIVAQAATMAKRMGQTVVVGCQDEDTSGSLIDFVTTQPIRIQGYTASSWVNLPVLQSTIQGDGRDRQYFPSLKSFVNTDIFNIVLQ